MLDHSRTRFSFAWLVMGLLLAGSGGTDQPKTLADEKLVQADNGTILGKLVDAAGRPLTGARVALYRAQGEWNRWEPFREAIDSDAAGTYRFEALPQGLFLVAVHKSGLAPAFHDAGLYDVRSCQLNLVLGPPVAAVLQISDKAGQPARGCVISASAARTAHSERSSRTCDNSASNALRATNRVG